jgi:uncharacterized protein (TIGR03000 family)
MKPLHKGLLLGLGVAAACLGGAAPAHAQAVFTPGAYYGPPTKWSYNVGMAIYNDIAYRPIVFFSSYDPLAGGYARPAGPLGASAGWGGAIGYRYFYNYAPIYLPDYWGTGTVIVPTAYGPYGAGAVYQGPYGPGVVNPAVMNGGPSPATTSPGTFVTPSPEPRPNTATVDVLVADPNAELWVNGNKAEQTGPARTFVTPELENGKPYNYEIRAKWTQNGKQYDQKRTVTVRAGEQVGLTFAVDDRVSMPANKK